MGRIVTAGDEHICRGCGRVIQPGEKMKLEMGMNTQFMATCIDCVEGAEKGYEAGGNEKNESSRISDEETRRTLR